MMGNKLLVEFFFLIYIFIYLYILILSTYYVLNVSKCNFKINETSARRRGKERLYGNKAF